MRNRQSFLYSKHVIVLSGDNECDTVTAGLITANYELKSNQEETHKGCSTRNPDNSMYTF